ncbi:hypothetical protein D9757_009538 [Collybiopsis confluens]|uniref:Uncharacterized protein n=1 Tax=Collybiopsis confluens TaxID=2823264 RepID=A0A8H5H901_9AGAR|nr:hypothetical protein D9757_009538 [Collybiopsis confluens]
MPLHQSGNLKAEVVIQNGGRGKGDLEGQMRQPGPHNIEEITLSDSASRRPSPTTVLRAATGTGTPVPLDAGSLDAAEELRGEVENLRREMDAMRMRTDYGPPPVYQ